MCFDGERRTKIDAILDDQRSSSKQRGVVGIMARMIA